MGRPKYPTGNLGPQTKSSTSSTSSNEVLVLDLSVATEDITLYEDEVYLVVLVKKCEIFDNELIIA